MISKPMLLAALSLASLALAAPASTASTQVKRGEYLVNFGGCHDCHTPKKMGPNGPELDTERLLSGHPEQMAVTPAPALAGPWLAATVATMTAWSGPWGISYSANLTPDRETGLGAWTEQNFVDTMRTGRHMGRGRPILPPMPWQMVKNGPAQRGLAGADLAGQCADRLATLDGTRQILERARMRRAGVEEPWIRRLSERIPGEFVEDLG